MEDAEIQREHPQNEEIEWNPEPERYLQESLFPRRGKKQGETTTACVPQWSRPGIDAV
jgi:hypothetical protein